MKFTYDNKEINTFEPMVKDTLQLNQFSAGQRTIHGSLMKCYKCIEDTTYYNVDMMSANFMCSFSCIEHSLAPLANVIYVYDVVKEKKGYKIGYLKNK